MIGYVVCVILGAMCGFFTCCLFERSSAEERNQEYDFLAGRHAKLKEDYGKLESQYWDLQLDFEGLRTELEEERYRHDRLQDFCVAQGKQLDAAMADLGQISECFTCADNGVVCPEYPVSPFCCERYRWRGAVRSEEIATPACALDRNENNPPEVADG